MVTPQEHRHVLVIGGAGYIGSVLVRKLLASGIRVRALDALLYKNESALEQLVGGQGFSFQRGDLCHSPDLEKALEGITDVVLLAALVGDPVCRKFPDLARKINEHGTLDLIDRLDRFGISRFIFMSTCSNYGLQPNDAPATEDTELNPQSLYAETKVKVERRLLQSAGKSNYCVTVLRAATAYGVSPRMRFDLTVNEFTKELAMGRELLVYDADTWRPYCHVEDICAAIMLVLEADRAIVNRQVFNVGDDAENHTKRMIVDLISGLLPASRIKFQVGSVDPRDYRVMFEKVRSTLDFKASHTVAQFAPELIDAVRRGRYDQAIASPDSFSNLAPTLMSH